MKIEFLAEHKDLVPILAKYNFLQWGEKSWSSLEEVTSAYTTTLNNNCIPLTLVAFSDDNKLLGFISLIDNDMSDRPELTPWLAALYVLPEHRKKGVGERLSRKLVEEAEKLGFKELFLYTGDNWRVAYYSKLGWEVIEKLKYKSEDSVVMRYQP